MFVYFFLFNCWVDYAEINFITIARQFTRNYGILKQEILLNLACYLLKYNYK